jgi:hypothetical protein
LIENVLGSKDRVENTFKKNLEVKYVVF